MPLEVIIGFPLARPQTATGSNMARASASGILQHRNCDYLCQWCSASTGGNSDSWICRNYAPRSFAFDWIRTNQSGREFSFCCCHGPCARLISQLTNLKKLDLQDNEITDLTALAAQQLDSRLVAIKSLDISKVRLPSLRIMCQHLYSPTSSSHLIHFLSSL